MLCCVTPLETDMAWVSRAETLGKGRTTPAQADKRYLNKSQPAEGHHLPTQGIHDFFQLTPNGLQDERVKIFVSTGSSTAEDLSMGV